MEGPGGTGVAGVPGASLAETDLVISLLSRGGGRDCHSAPRGLGSHGLKVTVGSSVPSVTAARCSLHLSLVGVWPCVRVCSRGISAASSAVGELSVWDSAGTSVFSPFSLFEAGSHLSEFVHLQFGRH